MAHETMRSIRGVENHSQGWGGIEWTPSPKSATPPTAEGWKRVESAAQLPRGIRILCRRPGTAAASFRCILPLIAETVGDEGGTAVATTLTPEQVAVSLYETVSAAQAATGRMMAMMTSALAVIEKAHESLDKREEQIDTVAGLREDLARERVQGRILATVDYYVNLIGGGIAVKTGAIKPEQWAAVKGALVNKGKAVALGVTDEEVGQLIEAFAGSRTAVPSEETAEEQGS